MCLKASANAAMVDCTVESRVCLALATVLTRRPKETSSVSSLGDESKSQKPNVGESESCPSVPRNSTLKAYANKAKPKIKLHPRHFTLSSHSWACHSVHICNPSGCRSGLAPSDSVSWGEQGRPLCLVLTKAPTGGSGDVSQR